MTDQYSNPDQDPNVPEGEGEQTAEQGQTSSGSGWDKKEEETKSFKATGPINVKGRDYAEGESILLTQDEYKALEEIKAPIEGIEQPDPEEYQSKHEEAIEAQNETIKARKESEDEVKEAGRKRREEDREKGLNVPDESLSKYPVEEQDYRMAVHGPAGPTPLGGIARTVQGGGAPAVNRQDDASRLPTGSPGQPKGLPR